MLRARRWLWALIVVGTVVRLAIAVTTDGVAYDVESFRLVRTALADDPLHAYGALNGPDFYRWPYPPAFFVWIEAAVAGARLAGGGYIGLIQLAPIAADAALAWVVASFLQRRGAPQRVWLAGGGLVALGPSFVAISGYAVQIDSVAVLPAAAALALWERGGTDRAWKAGLLVGLAAAIKTVPGIVVLALLPTVRDRREAAVLVGAALLVPAVTLAPFVVADASGVREMLRYNGVPGMGGLTLVLQPDLAETWLRRPTEFSGVTDWVFEHQRWINGALLAATTAFVIRYRVPAPTAAALLWLMVWAFGTGFFFQYLVWGLPFLLMAGYVRAAAVLQLVTIVPAIIFFAGPWESSAVVVLFVAIMLATWVGWVAGVAALARRSVRGPRVAAGTA